MFPAHVETERLDLRRFDDHVDLWTAYEYFGRDETIEAEMRHLTQEPDDTPKETFDRLAEASEEWTDAESALYAIFPKADERGGGELAGDAAFLPQWDKRSATFGVRLRKPYWGRGYSGERAAALMVVAFEHLDLEVITAGHFPENERGKRAIESYVDRFGGQKDGVMRNWVSDGTEVHDLHLYSVTREQFGDNRPDELDVVVHVN